MWNRKKQNKQKLSRLDWWLHRVWGMGQMRDSGQRVQTSSYKTSKFWESNIKPGDCS